MIRFLFFIETIPTNPPGPELIPINKTLLLYDLDKTGTPSETFYSCFKEL